MALNTQNLQTLTTEKAREIGRKGGKASVKARRERKAMRETLELLLNMPLNDGKNTNLDKIKAFTNLQGQNISVQDAILVKQIQKALKGDAQAVNIIRELTGEKVTEIKVQTNIDEKVLELSKMLDEY